MKINVQKTKMLVCGRIYNTKATFNSSEFTYLGSIINIDRRDTKEIDKRIFQIKAQLLPKKKNTRKIKPGQQEQQKSKRDQMCLNCVVKGGC